MKSIVLAILLLTVCSSLALDKRRDCKCKVQTSNRLVGGKETKTIYPFLVTFFKNLENTTNVSNSDGDKLRKEFCHGTIINERMILTTAICSKQNLQVSYGSDDLFQLYDNKIDSIMKVIPHPNLTFHDMKYYKMPVNDLAILILKNPIKFSKNVQPACFNLNNVEKYTEPLTVIGHGMTKVISKNHTPVIENLGNRYLKEIHVVDESSRDRKLCWYDALICSKGKTGKESPCVGDYGAPLMETINGKTSVIGLVSFPSVKADEERIQFCVGNQSTLYTRISKFWNWVKTHIGDIIAHNQKSFCPDKNVEFFRTFFI